MKIGFIGLGNMGAAIAQAVAKEESYHLLLSNHGEERARELQLSLGGEVLSNAEIASQADFIFLGVKPSSVIPVLESLQEEIASNPTAIWVSMAAGIDLKQLMDYIPSQQLIRMMPNTPVAIGQGMTTYCLTNPSLAPLFEQVMQSSGHIKQVAEQQIDAATALAGCGPAFVYQFIEAMADAGVQAGLSAQDSTYLAAQTLVGSAQMVLSSKKHPAQLRQEVTSPGGSTIAGVVALEKKGFRYAVIDAVQKALKRTKKLGKQ